LRRICKIRDSLVDVVASLSQTLYREPEMRELTVDQINMVAGGAFWEDVTEIFGSAAGGTAGGFEGAEEGATIGLGVGGPVGAIIGAGAGGVLGYLAGKAVVIAARGH
jgi:hypothetical protein